MSPGAIAGRRLAWAAYCVAHVGKSLLWAASDLLTLYVLVTLYAIDPALAGLGFLIALAANALADLGIGVWLDRHPRHAATLAAGALVVAATVFPATMLAAPLGTVPLFAAMIVFRVAYAGYDVPHNALMTRLAPDTRQATWLSRGRTVGTGIAGLAVALTAQAAVDPQRITPLLWTLAIAALTIGAVAVPLVRWAGLAPPPPTVAGARFSLPPAFLAASVIGIVALGALGKAVLHAPAGTAPMTGSMMLVLLTCGRTASALVPVSFATSGRGLAILAGAYLAAALLALAFTSGVATPLVLMLGFAMGLTNLIGWALLPSLARGARGYGLYTMVSKLALGTAGLALAGGLGRAPVFTQGGFVGFALFVAAGCVIAAILAWPRLTSLTSRALSRE